MGVEEMVVLVEVRKSRRNGKEGGRGREREKRTSQLRPK